METLTCTIAPNGRLRVTCNNAMRRNIAEWQSLGRDYWTQICDCFEQYSANGSFTPFDASDGNPFVGLTGAPCVAESMSYCDDGENIIVGRLWFFQDYAIRDPLDELKTRGVTYFEYGGGYGQ